MGVGRGARRGRSSPAGRTARFRPLTPISCRIQTHPARRDLIPPLLQRLDGFDDLVVVEDPEPGASVANAWRSYRACLESIPEDCSHLLVIQDDATVCDHFAEGVRLAVDARPDRVLAFFVAGAPHRSSQAVVQAGARGDAWAEWVSGEWFPCVCSCYPRGVVAEFLAYVDARAWAHGGLGDDHRLGSFLRDSGIGALCSVPNLAQHEDRVPSLIGTANLAGLNPARISTCWINRFDPREVEWERGPR